MNFPGKYRWSENGALAHFVEVPYSAQIQSLPPLIVRQSSSYSGFTLENMMSLSVMESRWLLLQLGYLIQIMMETMTLPIAIIRLSRNVTFSNSMTPICLPVPTQNYEQREVFVTGWGTLYSNGPQPDVLYKVGLFTITNSMCTTNTLYSSSDITSSMICARKTGKDSCQGDSGGPLISPEGGGRYFSVIGVVSWGYGCALADAPGVYSRVTSQLAWIEGQVQGTTCVTP